MGVPKFAAWLTKKYPTMVGRVCPTNVHGLYVDLNGLIHPCCHDEHDPSVALQSDEQKLRNICLAVEVLVLTTRPQHVVYIAVDGVAPRAKMNQQRSRRYMNAAEPLGRPEDSVAAIEAEFTDEQKTVAAKALDDVASGLQADALYGGLPAANGTGTATESEAGDMPPDALLPAVDSLLADNAEARPTLPTARSGKAAGDGADGEHFDSNCISPGTVFMEKVSVAVRSYLQERVASGDPLWAKATVVFSDASAPGEGEHKLLDFLRTQSSFSGFNGRGAHVIAGLDADLIFLSLSLHIPQVVILRDNKRPSFFGTKDSAKRVGHASGAAEGKDSDSAASSLLSSPTGEAGGNGTAAGAGFGDGSMGVEPCKTYEYYDIDVVGASIVSEVYLLSQLKGFTMKADVRAHTDGELVAGNGYCFDRVAGDPAGERKGPRPGVKGKQEHDFRTFHPCTAASNAKIVDDFIVMAMIMGNDFLPRVPSAFCGESAMDNILEMYVGEVLPYGYLTSGTHDIDLRQLARFFLAYAKIEAVKFRQYCIKCNTMTAEQSASPVSCSDIDDVWRRPYYTTTSVNKENLEEACRLYVEGLRFVWRYYSSTSAQVSWSWYYPFHHGPFAFDIFKFLQAQGPNVQTALPPPRLETQPPDIFAQQLCILPPSSKQLVPEIFRRYMTKPPDDLSDTFPKEWTVDYTAAYGKDHLSTVMLPFANMDRLQQMVREFSSHLTAEEAQRQKTTEFHLVLKRRDDAAAETPAAAVGDDNEEGTAESEGATAAGGRGARRRPPLSYTFEINGKGLKPLAASQVPRWELKTDCPELAFFQLRDTVPERSRPRTYSYTVPIFNLTTGADGKVMRMPRRGRSSQAEDGAAGGRGRGGGRGQGGGRRGREAKESSGGEEDDAMSIGRIMAMSTPSFVEFALCAGGVAMAVLLYTTPLFALAVKVQLVGLVVAMWTIAYTLGFAVGGAGRRKGSGIHRNSIRMTFVDWQCGNCLMLNFAKNNRCFMCSSPFDEHRDWALFGGRNPPEPPLMDTDHSKYVERFGFVH